MRPQGAPNNSFSRLATRIALLLGLAAVFAAPVKALELRVTDDSRTAGYVTLAWENEGDIELQQRTGEAGWRTVYRGGDSASTFTGLDDGEYAWRARAVADDESGEPSPAPWGQPLVVEIAHHPLERALVVFAAGAVMFLILMACIAMPWHTAAAASRETTEQGVPS